VVRRWNVEAILVCNLGPEFMRFCAERAVPIAIVAGNEPVESVAQVQTDWRSIGRVAAQHFLERGFRRLAYC
jgi:DNA-binding LacI/PurR family transcriptional regulator